MAKFDEVFTSKLTHVFLPVIHVEAEDQAVRNMKIARDNGADGVFLINHTIRWSQLLSVYDWARGSFPTFWIGINCLDLDRSMALQHAPTGLQGLWCDNGGVDDIGVSQNFFYFENLRKSRGWKGLYFGGVAHKGQNRVYDPALAAKHAVGHIDVITTSGDSTGQPPEVSKIQAMRRAINGHPLAIASGMSVENVERFMPYCDCFLVASSIGHSFSELDPQKTLAFAKKLGK